MVAAFSKLLHTLFSHLLQRQLLQVLTLGMLANSHPAVGWSPIVLGKRAHTSNAAEQVQQGRQQGPFNRETRVTPGSLTTMLLGLLRNYDEDFDRRYSTSLLALLFIASSRGVWPQRSLTFRSALPCSTSILVCTQGRPIRAWPSSDAALAGPDECSNAYSRGRMLSAPLLRHPL